MNSLHPVLTVIKGYRIWQASNASFAVLFISNNQPPFVPFSSSCPFSFSEPLSLNSSSEVPGSLPSICQWYLIDRVKFQAFYALMDIRELIFPHSKSIITSVQSLPLRLHLGQITKKDQSCFFCQPSYNTFPSLTNSLEAIWVSDVLMGRNQTLLQQPSSFLREIWIPRNSSLLKLRPLWTREWMSCSSNPFLGLESWFCFSTTANFSVVDVPIWTLGPSRIIWQCPLTQCSPCFEYIVHCYKLLLNSNERCLCCQRTC